MRFNDRELALFAQSEQYGHINKHGHLFKKGERSRDGYRRRYFVLKGNLLFYSKDKDSAPLGCIVLERALVRQGNDDEADPSQFHFRLEFETSTSRVYRLYALSSQERDEWVTTLRQVGFEYLQKRFETLRRAIRDLTGKDPVNDTAMGQLREPSQLHPIERSGTVKFKGKRHSIRPSVVHNSWIEITCECTVTLMNGRLPNTSIELEMFDTAQGSWKSLGATETIEESSHPKFRQPIHIPASMATSTKLQFKILGHPIATTQQLIAAAQARECACDEPEEEEEEAATVPSAASAAVALAQQASGAATKASARDDRDGEDSDYDDDDDDYGELSDLRAESVSFRKTLATIEMAKGKLVRSIGNSPVSESMVSEQVTFFRATCRYASENPQQITGGAVTTDGRTTYSFNLQKLRIVDTMEEASMFLKVPDLIMRHFNRLDATTEGELRDLEGLVGPMLRAKRELRNAAQDRHTKYSDWTQKINADELTFKRSKDKKVEAYSMLPTNLHVQTLSVSDPSGDTVMYGGLTMGIPAAHALGFKAKGLRTSVGQLDMERKRLQLENPDYQPFDTAHITQKLTHFHTQLEKLSEQCSVLAVSDAETKEQLLGLLKTIVEGTCQLLQHPHILRALHFSESVLSLHVQLESRPDSARDAIRTYSDAFHELHTQLQQDFDSDLTRKLLLSSFKKSYEAMWRDVKRAFVATRLRVDEIYVDVPELIKRRDIVFSQFTTALVESFLLNIKLEWRDPLYLLQLQEVGYFVQVSSLLSTQGDEEDMIDDAWQGLLDLYNVKLVFTRGDFVNLQQDVTFNRYRVIFEVGVPDDVFNSLPPRLKDGSKKIVVHPVMFTLGVNEMQSISHAIGGAGMQNDLNQFSMQAFEKYFERFSAFHTQHQDTSWVDIQRMQQGLFALKHAIEAQKKKDMEVLHRSQWLCHAMKGGRITCCKSGKDRTSMAVSLELVLLLKENHQLPEDLVQETLDRLRRDGSRRVNVQKNIGDSKYAFNSMQVKTLPKQLRPPPGTYGFGVTT
eukprot:m.55857 g.55857  ORF g.55857 m.55857 type:complete len:1021 (+) comp11527_c1_seq1:165-3227(+)